MAHIRLCKLTKQFNIGLQTLVDFLDSKGVYVEMNPNATISDEYLRMIEAKFGDEQKLKQDSDKVAIKLKDIIEYASRRKNMEEDEPVREIVIESKNITLETSPETETNAVQQSVLKQKEPASAHETGSRTTIVTSRPKVVDRIDLSKFENHPSREDKKEDPAMTSVLAESYNPKTIERLWDWAYMGDYNKAIADLEKMALKGERWYYKEQDPDNPFPILKKYLEYTFIRLAKEKTTIKYTENGEYAAFNTGLVDNLYDPIYALFEKNKIKDKQPWRFMDFCIPGKDKAGKILSSNFNPLPERAHYFTNLAELIYDCEAPEPHVDWEHIILEHVDRLPSYFLAKYVKDELKDTSTMQVLERNRYYKHLAKVIESNDTMYRDIKNRFKDSLELALHRVAWNYKTAIPTYYPKTNSLSLLLPLSLDLNDKIDLALVTERQTSGNYICHTILPLSWAYSNARLITRPDSDWLTPDAGEIDIEEDD